MNKLVLLLALSTAPLTAKGADMSHGADNFYASEKVTVGKVTFDNQYRMKAAGNLFVPRNLDRKAKHPAIVVGHPMER